MNANELADKLEYLYQQDDADGIQMPVFLYSATMLRQQQAEIEALKIENSFFRNLMSDVEILRKAQEK